jgi:hypothetical protein
MNSRVRFAQASARRTLRKFSGRRDMLSKAAAQRVEFRPADQFLSHFTYPSAERGRE